MSYILIYCVILIMKFFLSVRSKSHIGVHVNPQDCFVIGITWGIRTGLDTQSPRHLVWYSSAPFYRSVRFPIWETWEQLTRQQTNTGISTALTAEKHWNKYTKTLRNVTNCDISIDSLHLPEPEVGDFEELLLLHNTADIRHTYHLSSLKYTAAIPTAKMCDSAGLFVL